MADISIYTDGASSGNPGPGGFGTVMISGQHKREISQGYKLTTNNRMELMSVIAGLEALKSTGNKVLVVSDSKYVVDSVEKGWVFNWQKTGFKGKKNVDLWTRFLRLYPKNKIKFEWIKGHSGHVMNERCDELAVAAYKSGNLLEDTGYLSEQKLF